MMQKDVVTPQYQPLNTAQHEIRLIERQDVAGFLKDGTIRCKLVTLSLEDFTPEYKEWHDRVGVEIASPKQRTQEWQAYKYSIQPDSTTLDYFRFRWGDYIAVSYHWGNTELTHTILLDGQPFRVPESVDLALRTFFTPDAELPGKNIKKDAGPTIEKKADARYAFLWMDFLCINQEDAKEKGEQIGRMQNIFGSAYVVYVHLGIRDAESDLAFDLINKVTHNAMEGFDYSDFLIRRAAETQSGVKFSDQDAYRAVFKLFSRPYWRRMWIIQELAMADDLCMVFCGDRSITLYAARTMAKIVSENLMAIRYFVDLTESWFSITNLQDGISLLWYIGRLRQQMRSWQTSENITYTELRSPALGLAQSASASHQYDKIFGMLGMLPNAIQKEMEPLLTQLPSSNSHAITSTSIDQENKDEAERAFISKVFVSFGIAVIRNANDLDIIFARNTFQMWDSKLHLPSWVTDWTLRGDRCSVIPLQDWHFTNEDYTFNRYLEKGKQINNLHLVSRKWTCQFGDRRADGNKAPQIRFSKDHRILFCQAVQIGYVDGIAPEMDTYDYQHMDKKWPERLLQPKTKFLPYGDKDGAKDALLRTLFMDPLDENKDKGLILSIPWYDEAAMGEDEAAQLGKDLIANGWDPKMLFGNNFVLWEAVRREIRDYKVGLISVEEYFPSTITKCATPLVDQDLGIVCGNLANRRLVTLNSGHLGLAPSIVHPGDRIFVIVGCSTPVILRGSEENENTGYQVIGECYVEGFMKGECMEQVRSGNMEMRDISLC
jgi:hypothetical protein